MVSVCRVGNGTGVKWLEDWVRGGRVVGESPVVMDSVAGVGTALVQAETNTLIMGTNNQRSIMARIRRPLVALQ